MPAADTPPSLPQKPLYALYSSEIVTLGAQKFVNHFARATQGGYRELRLSINSTGGAVSDGIFLYNLLRSSPIPVTAYNMGSVQSIATIVFLGAKKRVVSKHGLFMVHRTTFNLQNVTVPMLKGIVENGEAEDNRTETILRSHVTLQGRDWTDLREQSFWFNAQEALSAGIATEIGEFSPPPGAEIWSFTL